MIIISGPCQVESVDHALRMASLVKAVSMRLGMAIIFKASFDKANRTSGESPRGAGLELALAAFTRIKAEFAMPITTDVHEAWQCKPVAEVVDYVQIPALLMRQTDLIAAAADTGKVLTIKKGQGVAPHDMRHAIRKAFSAGAEEVWAIERGSSFGHNDLVVDMRGLPIMRRSADRVIFDASHSAQLPSSLNGQSGGNRAVMPVLARAAVAAGVDGVFVETHDDPDNALSDGPIAWPADRLYEFLAPLCDLHVFVGTLPALA